MAISLAVVKFSWEQMTIFYAVLAIGKPAFYIANSHVWDMLGYPCTLEEGIDRKSV